MKRKLLFVIGLFASGCVPGEAPTVAPPPADADTRRTQAQGKTDDSGSLESAAKDEPTQDPVGAAAAGAESGARAAATKPQKPEEATVTVTGDADTELALQPREITVKTPEASAQITVKKQDGGEPVVARAGEAVAALPDTTVVVTVTSGDGEVTAEVTATTPAAIVDVESAAVEIAEDGSASVVVEASSDNPPSTPLLVAITDTGTGAVTLIDPVTDTVVTDPATVVPPPQSVPKDAEPPVLEVPLEVIADVLAVAPDRVSEVAVISVVAVNQAGAVAPAPPPVVIAPAAPVDDELAEIRAQLKEVRAKLKKLKKAVKKDKDKDKDAEKERKGLVELRDELLKRLKKLKASRPLPQKLKKKDRERR